LAEVIINERDEYMSQTICEIARVGFRPPYSRPKRIVAVVGAGHLIGLQRILIAGGVSEQRMQEISKSSKQSCPTWPGSGVLQVVNTKILFPDGLEKASIDNGDDSQLSAWQQPQSQVSPV